MVSTTKNLRVYTFNFFFLLTCHIPLQRSETYIKAERKDWRFLGIERVWIRLVRRFEGIQKGMGCEKRETRANVWEFITFGKDVMHIDRSQTGITYECRGSITKVRMNELLSYLYFRSAVLSNVSQESFISFNRSLFICD